MTTSRHNIVWPEVYARLPWVTRLKRGEQCTGLMYKTSFRAISVLRTSDAYLSTDDLAYKRKFQCKNSARWRYDGLKPSVRFPRRTDTSGTYCWSHLYSRGIYGSMEEEDRVLRWFRRNDPTIYRILCASMGVTHE